MDVRRTADAIEHAALDVDRELAAALAVDPSPEFLARVRMRIAAEPEPPAWRVSWLVAVAGACAVTAAVGAAAVQTGQAVLPSSATRILADISLLVPGLVPGPFAIAASVPPRDRRERPSPEMQAAMRSNAATTQAVSAHLARGDHEAILQDAATLSRNLASIEAFWSAREVELAAGLSREGLKAAADLRAAAVAGDDRRIEEALAAMTAICSACHLRFREELPDHTYAIKL
jgi:hypothetical protein